MAKKKSEQLPLLPVEREAGKRKRLKAKPMGKKAPGKKAPGKKAPGKRRKAPAGKRPNQASRVRLAKARWYVQRTTFEGQQVRREGEIELAPFHGPVSYVGARYKSVIGVPGSFSSETVEVSLSMPCYPAEVDGMADAVTDWCARRIVQERDELVSYIGLRTGQATDRDGASH